MRYFFLCLCLVVMGCTTGPGGTSTGKPSEQKQRQSELNFLIVVRQMEPTIESECAKRRGRKRCDFQIIIDDRPGQKPNAFQTVFDDGTPVIGFTEALLYDVRNKDELAFVLGHEAAHHMLNHLGRQKKTAEREAREFEKQARSVGASEQEIQAARAAGAATGALAFSKEFEIEADVLGAILTRRAGFDALKGSAYFSRIPDPKNGVLSTHPPNAERQAAVRKALNR